ncbi:hypothetical protein PsorP6_002909 [Peronosclerospora sorghi]|uniref:Uncharacterized protein n=1 Tax=Peronosclerospora sorghi TaxID=230839 RepID=A0ACC0VM77_9STRA|nr:hypothetical protein PsorP6_002909 [Peronosclerospora sorghi]
MNPTKDHLLAMCGDGRLSAYDLGKNVLAGKSDELDDKLLSVSGIKNGRKIVYGSQDGVLHDKSIIGSTSHTNKLNIRDVGYLFELYDDVEVNTVDKNEEKVFLA